MKRPAKRKGRPPVAQAPTLGPRAVWILVRPGQKGMLVFRSSESAREYAASWPYGAEVVGPFVRADVLARVA
jgi:hypothetical protein